MNIFIAEDEPLAAAKLKLFLQKLGENDVFVLDNGLSLLSHFEKEVPEVLFLDIHMPGADGMQVLETMQKHKISNVQVIITSAFEQYALESFGFNVTDYLLKPYTLERLSAALEKARNNIRLLSLDKQNNSKTISFRSDGLNYNIPESEVMYLEALKDYVRICTSDGKRRLTRSTTNSFEKTLSDEFIRIHRSFIVNRNYITGFNLQSISLQGDVEIPVGKTYREQIDKLLIKNK